MGRMGRDGGDVCSNDFSRCLECHGVRHDTLHERLKCLFGDWMLGLHWGVTWRSPSHAVTTEVVTTNMRKRLKSLLGNSSLSPPSSLSPLSPPSSPSPLSPPSSPSPPSPPSPLTTESVCGDCGNCRRTDRLLKICFYCGGSG